MLCVVLEYNEDVVYNYSDVVYIVKDFRTGMNEYLAKFAYKNAATEDLWASLSSASGKPVDMVMSTWTKKMGYPVLTVSAKQVICTIVIIWFTMTMG